MISRVRDLFQRNLLAKILALLLAVALWAYVMNDQNPSIEGSFTVPLKLINAPEGYQISRETNSVVIHVRGARSQFVNVDEKDFSAYVELGSVNEGSQNCRVHVIMPQGFELVEVEPDEAKVTLDRIDARDFRAELIVTGATAQGTTVAKVSQSQPNVTVEGPGTQLAEVTRVIGYVGLSGNSTDFSLQVPLTAINSDGKEVAGVEVQPATVRADVQLARGLTRKVVTIKPVAGAGLADKLELASLKTDPIKIEIAGEDEVINTISEIETEPISLSGITQKQDKTVRLRLPEGVTVTNKDVMVHIEVRAKSETSRK